MPARPPAAPDYGFDDDPAPASGSRDGTAGSEAREPEREAGPATRERPGREAAEQSAAPGREHAEAEPETTAEAAGKQGEQDQQAERNEQAARETPALPQQDYGDAVQHAPADADPPPDTTAVVTAVPEAAEPTSVTALPAETESVTEADNGQDNADTAVIAAPGDDIPVTPTASPDGELPAESESQPAERPEDPAASLTTTEAVAQEPGTGEPDPDEAAQPEDPLAAIRAEPGVGGDNDSGETTVAPEAGSAQVSAAEHDPQTQDPEPEPETVLAVAETGDPASADTASSPVSETTDPASGAETGEQSDDSPEARDENAEAPPWAAAMMSAFKDLQAKNQELEQKVDDLQANQDAKIDAVKEELEAKRQEDAEQLRAEYDARLEAAEAQHQEETDQLRQRISDLEAQEGDQQEQFEAEESDAAGMRINAESAREAEPEAEERPESDIDDAHDGAVSVAGTAGLVNPVLQLVLSANSAYRKYQDLSPDGKYETNRLVETYFMAASSMSPETAFAAVTTAVALTKGRGTLQSVFDKLRRKDHQDES